MTRDEVLALPAGRELDALVDETVFGHRQCNATHAQSGGWCMSCNPPIWEELPGGFKHGRPTQTVRAKNYWPAYSTDIAAAWEVVEKLLTMFKYVNVCSGRLAHSQPVTFHVRCENSGWGPYESQADTAPLAICRAGLLCFA